MTGTIRPGLPDRRQKWLVSCVRTIANLVPARAYVYYVVDVDPVLTDLFTPDCRRSGARPYETSVRSIDPFHPEVQAGSDVHVLRFEDAVPGPDRWSSDWYIRFMRPRAIAYMLDIFVRDEKKRVSAGFTITRGRNMEPFTAGEISSLEKVYGLLECAVHEHLLATTGTDAARADLGLSERERAVAALLRQGCTDKQIAGRLHIQLTTAKTYVRRILEKTGARNRAAAVSILYC